MEKYKKLLIFLMLFSVGFIISTGLIELSTYLLNLPNTIANFFGSIIFIGIFALIIIFGYKSIKYLNK